MALTREEIEEMAKTTANEVIGQLKMREEELELRDSILGSMMGEGAIPLYGRETRKTPCRGCRIDMSKPFEPGNIMATTEGAIGTLSVRELRDWCSEIAETEDGRCERVRKIREAARACREKYPSDTKKFFECYAPAWASTTEGHSPHSPEDESLTPRAIREGRHPYSAPGGIPAKVYPVRATTGEGYSLFDMSEGVWFGSRRPTYEEAVAAADRENRRLWEAEQTRIRYTKK